MITREQLLEALDWIKLAFEDIDQSRMKLRRSDPILDRAERCIKTLEELACTALSQANTMITEKNKIVIDAYRLEAFVEGIENYHNDDQEFCENLRKDYKNLMGRTNYND